MNGRWLKLVRGHPMPKVHVEYEVRDARGKLLRRGRVVSRTWVSNFLKMLQAIMGVWASASQLSVYVINTASVWKRTDGTAEPIYLGTGGSGSFGGAAPSGETSAGILVGSSSNPLDLTQYNLGSLIAHGSGAGQLLYGSTTVESVVESASSASLRIIRTFSNSSGGTVTVYEFGLFFKGYAGTFMFTRDVVSNGIAVPNGATLTLRYIISVSV